MLRGGKMNCTKIPCLSFLFHQAGKLIIFVNLQRLNFSLSFCSSQVQMISNELTFTNVRFQEDGVYQCVAENNVDMIVSYTWVNVIGNY